MTYLIAIPLAFLFGALSRERRIAWLEHRLACVIAHRDAVQNTLSAFDDKPTDGFKVAWLSSRIPEFSPN